MKIKLYVLFFLLNFSGIEDTTSLIPLEYFIIKSIAATPLLKISNRCEVSATFSCNLFFVFVVEEAALAGEDCIALLVCIANSHI